MDYIYYDMPVKGLNKMIRQIRNAFDKCKPLPNFSKDDLDKVFHVHNKKGPFVNWTVRHEWKLRKNMDYFRVDPLFDVRWIRDEIRNSIKREIYDSDLEPEEWDRTFIINNELNQIFREVAIKENISWFWDENGFDENGYDRGGFDEAGFDDERLHHNHEYFELERKMIEDGFDEDSEETRLTSGAA